MLFASYSSYPPRDRGMGRKHPFSQPQLIVYDKDDELAAPNPPPPPRHIVSD